MIVGSRWIYVGKSHRFLQGETVEIVAVHRGPNADEVEILESDEQIGTLREDDLIEVAPIIREAGRERRSFATSDARLADLRPA